MSAILALNELQQTFFVISMVSSLATTFCLLVKCQNIFRRIKLLAAFKFISLYLSSLHA